MADNPRPKISDEWEEIAGIPPIQTRRYSEKDVIGRPNVITVKVERTADLITPTVRKRISEEIAEKVKHKKGRLASVWLNTVVYVAGPEIDGEPITIEESSEDQWIPTNRWEVRRLYRSPVVSTSKDKVGRIDNSLSHVLSEAFEHHDDNRAIYITSISVLFFFGEDK